RLDSARASRRRHDALADLGELVLDLIRRGEIDLVELPEARELVRELDDLDDPDAAVAEPEPEPPRPALRRPFAHPAPPAPPPRPPRPRPRLRRRHRPLRRPPARGAPPPPGRSPLAGRRDHLDTRPDQAAAHLAAVARSRPALRPRSPRPHRALGRRTHQRPDR